MMNINDPLTLHPPKNAPEMLTAASVARAQKGDSKAMGELFDQYRLSVFRYLYYRTGDTQAAEDLTSEVFLRMMRALPNYQPQSAPFEAWLYQIARNLAIDHHRKSASSSHLPLEENLVRHSHPFGDEYDRRLTSATLAQALEQLGDLQRDIVVLRFINNMPIAQVARALHKTEDSVKAHQRRALSALRELLIQWEFDHD